MGSLQEQSIVEIQAVIKDWQAERKFTWESKKVYANRNPSMSGEFILHVSNSVDSFIKDGQLINTFQLSPYFLTNTLSFEPLSDNPKGDSYRLKEFLKKFDEDFYKSIEEKTSGEGVYTTDPLLW